MEKKYPKNLSGALRIIHNKFAIPNIAIIALAIMMILGMSACGSAGNPSSPKLPKPLLELSGTIDISPNSGVTIGTPLTANYTGTESVTYRWKKDETTISTNGKNFTPYEAGSYTVTVGANGFKDKTSQTVIVTVIDEPSPGLTFTLNDTGTAYLVSKGTITDTAVVIPAKHEGLPVTGIADNGFANYSMTSIGIPDSVTSIGSGAFSGCTGLASIALPDSVMSIGIGAFSDCSGLTSITLPFTGETWDGTTPNTHFGYIFGASNATDQNSSLPAKLKTVTLTSGTSIADNAFSGCGLTSITIPASVISIGSGAFSDCTLLTSFTIPAGVESIGNDAFSGCFKLASITIPAGVTSIGSGAFSGCNAFTSVTVPDSVMSIGSGAFSDCGGLTSITLPFTGETWDGTTPNTHFGYIFGASNAIDQNSSLPAKLKTVTLTSGTSIADNAFSGCGLTSITIPASVISIGSGAFSDCTLLTSFTIPAGVESIGNDAFSGCFKLASITIPAGVTSIGSGAFSGCNAFTSVTVPDSVMSIGIGAFSDCGGLTSITLPFTGETWDGTTPNTHFGYIFGATDAAEQDSSRPPKLKTVTITSGIKIADNAFSGCGLTNITIPASVTSIGNGAFLDCIFLASFTIPGNVESIGDNAFSGCYALKSITVPASVTNIGSGAFSDCIGLTSITIPFIGETRDGTTPNTHFGYIFGASNYSGQLSSIPNKLNTVILTGGNSIADNAFSGCSGLTSVTIPGSVKSIGLSAFSGCTKLASITIPAGVTSIGSGAFSGCGLTSITIPASVTSIGSGAFSGCNTLASISIPFVGETRDGTTPNTHFGYIFGAKDYNSQALSIPASLKTVIITGGTSIAQLAFYNCTDLTNITIPSSVTDIAMGAFKGCNGLTSITIPFVGKTGSSGPTHFGHIFDLPAGTKGPDTLKKVMVTGGTKIAGNAFANWVMITDIILPDSVTSIDTNAFSNCISLESITIPTGVKVIGTNTFNGCKKLTKVYYRGDASAWGTSILVAGSNDGLNSATIYGYSETDPGTGGKYWRFVDGVPAIW